MFARTESNIFCAEKVRNVNHLIDRLKSCLMSPVGTIELCLNLYQVS